MDLELLNLRRSTAADHILRQRLSDGALLKLTPEIAVAAAEYRALPPWARARVRARAFGMASDRAVLCSLSAARLLGIQLLSWDDTVELSYVDSRSVPPARQRQPRVVYRSSRLTRSEVTALGGIRVTGLERTLIDIARYHGVVEGTVAIDSALRRHRELSEQWLAAAGANRRMHGIGLFRRAVQLCDERSESPKETKARVLLETAGLPYRRLQPQAEMTLGSKRVRVDLLIDGWLVVEVDGNVKYDGITFGKPTDEVLMAERRREKALQNAGFTVLRTEHSHMIPRDDGSVALVELVRAALARRARAA